MLRISAGASRGIGLLLDDAHALAALHQIGRVVDGRLVLHGELRLGGALVSPDDVVAFDPALDWACVRIDARDPGERAALGAPGDLAEPAEPDPLSPSVIAAARDQLHRELAEAVPARGDAELVFAEHAQPGLAASACLVTSEPEALGAELRGWHRNRQASLRALFDDPATRGELLAWAARARFSLYAYYAPAPDDRLVLPPLVHRLRKRHQQLLRIHARRDIAVALGRAIAQVQSEAARPLPTPALVRSGPLIDLAELLLAVVARRLADPASEQARAEVALVRPRLRLLMNAATDASGPDPA